MIKIEVKGFGTIMVELDKEAAPKTVENFEKLVSEGFYDGLTFHRIIKGFMIQGGDPKGNGTGDSKVKIPGEFKSNGWDNPISHKRGVISMARAQNPNSASCQFFIVHEDSEFLDGDYAAFGHVTDGMDVVDAIASVSLRGREKIPGIPVASQEEALSAGKARGTPGSCHHSQSPQMSQSIPGKRVFPAQPRLSS